MAVVLELPDDCCDECPDGLTITAGGVSFTSEPCCDTPPTLCGNINVTISTGAVITITV